MNIVIMQDKELCFAQISKKNTLLEENIKTLTDNGFLLENIYLLGVEKNINSKVNFINKLSDISSKTKNNTIIVSNCIYLKKDIIIKIKNISSEESIHLLGGKEKTGLYFIPTDKILTIDISKLNSLKEKNILKEDSYKLVNNTNDINILRKNIGTGNPKEAFVYCPHVTLAADKFYNIFAFNIVRLFIPYSITPNQVSTISFVLSFIGIGLFFLNSYSLMIVGLILLHIGFIFDCVDGGLARIKMCGSNAGGFLDSTFDSLKMTFLILGIVYYDFYNNENSIILLLGLLLFALKYTNTTVYNNATHFSKNTLASEFVPKKGLITNIMSKLKIKPNQLTLSNDVLLIIFSFGLIFNINIYIFIALLIYYTVQLTVFGFITFNKLNKEIK